MTWCTIDRRWQWISSELLAVGSNGDGCDSNGNGAAPVPEPSTILLMGAGLLGLVAVGRRKFNRKE